MSCDINRPLYIRTAILVHIGVWFYLFIHVYIYIYTGKDVNWQTSRNTIRCLPMPAHCAQKHMHTQGTWISSASLDAWSPACVLVNKWTSRSIPHFLHASFRLIRAIGMGTDLWLAQFCVVFLCLGYALCNSPALVLVCQLCLGHPLPRSLLPVSVCHPDLLQETAFWPVPVTLDPLLIQDLELIMAWASAMADT